MAEKGDLELGSYKIHLTDKLGQGTFGVVYSGTHKKSKEKVAVKQCEIQSDNYGFMAMKEIKHFQQLENHPNIVKLLDFHYTKNSFWMIMEYCDAGDLAKYIKTVNPDLDSKLNIMYQCASAIAFMHTRTHPVVHRDIKPANIMMKTEGGKSLVKVTDFGLSKVVEDAPDPGMTMMFSTNAGTPGFMAPEFFLKQDYSSSVDVFALGLVFLTLLEYKKGDRELLPLSVNARKSGGMIMPVGMEMAQFQNLGMPSPELISDSIADSPKVKTIKKLIRNMVQLKREDRMRMTKVEQELAGIGGTPQGSVALPPQKKQPDKSNFDLDKSNPKQQRTMPLSSSDEGKEGGSSDDSADVGFMLLKEALEHAIRDKMTSVDRKATEKEMKDVPIASLLHHVLGDDGVDKFNVGDRVRVIVDADELRDLQKGHGEWNDRMIKYLGKECTIKEKILHVVKVQFDDGQIWSYNPLCLRGLEEKSSDEGLKCVNNSLAGVSFSSSDAGDWINSKFQRYSVVELPEDEEIVKTLQKNHGGWNPKMRHCLGVKGIVNRIDKDGDVFVECINGDDWTFNPEILIFVDMSKQVLEAGDFVIVYDDKEKVRKLQDDHGGWVETMNAGLGKSGIVQSVWENKAKVETRGRSFIWNVEALVLVAKGEEMLRAVLKKKVSA